MKSFKNIKKTTLLFLLLFFGGYIFLRFWNARLPTADLIFKEQSIVVQVARTPWHMARGLGGREEMGRYDGMLFVFSSKETHGIVMRDMEFPIDIVWLDGGVVIDFAPRVPTEVGVKEQYLRVYKPRLPADTVLELPAGWTELYGLKIGDRLEVDSRS